MTACTFPKNETELLDKGVRSETQCHLVEVNEAVDRVEKYLSHCFRPEFIQTSPVAGFHLDNRVKIYSRDESTIFNIYSPSGTAKGYYMYVNISPGNDSCNTKVDVVVLNDNWRSSFNYIDAIVRGDEAKCQL